MTRYPQTIDGAITAFCSSLKAEGTYTPRTIRHYSEQCHCVFNILARRREEILPQNMTKADMVWFLEQMEESGYTVETRKGYFHALRRITLHYNNPVAARMKIRWPHDNRPNVDWLTMEQAQGLLDHPKTPNQDLITHLELCMGLRRCEVARLTVDSIQAAHIDVTGKGPMGGKPRIVPFHPRTADVIARYIKYRNALISAAYARFPATTVVPSTLLIWERAGRLHSYSEHKLSGLDNQLRVLSDELGFKFSNHTLRRTFGRVMYRSGVPVATISKLLGHEDTVTTLRYIGVDLDDMESAMSMYTLR